jgi:hypothetical protein
MKTFPLSVTDMGGFYCSHEELQYARKVVSYNETVASGGAKPELLPSFASLFPEDTRQVGAVLHFLHSALWFVTIPDPNYPSFLLNLDV